jgi:hypothetical protein
MDQAVSLATRSRRFESSFYPCKVNLNTRRGEALCPHTHQLSPSIPRQQNRAHRLGVQCLTDRDCRRAVTALVPTITGMETTSQVAWGAKSAARFNQVLGLAIYHISRHMFSTFKRLTHGTTPQSLFQFPPRRPCIPMDTCPQTNIIMIWKWVQPIPDLARVLEKSLDFYRDP